MEVMKLATCQVHSFWDHVNVFLHNVLDPEKPRVSVYGMTAATSFTFVWGFQCCFSTMLEMIGRDSYSLDMEGS